MASLTYDFHKKQIERNLISVPAFVELKSTLGTQHDVDFYIAGGAIRNLINQASTEINDIDIFVSIIDKDSKSLDRLINALSRTGHLEFGPYGSPRWYPVKGQKFYYDIVPFSKFNVGLGTPHTIDETLHQFDFTANAVAYNIFNPNIHNPVNGLSHLNSKLLKAVRLDFPDKIISPEVPISRLTILWFRFIHYASKLNFTIEHKTLNWLSHNSYRASEANLFEHLFFKPELSPRILSLL